MKKTTLGFPGFLFIRHCNHNGGLATIAKVLMLDSAIADIGRFAFAHSH